MSRLLLVSNGLQRMRARLTRTRWNGPRRWVAIAFIFALTTGVAWAYWSAGSSPGGGGASAAATVNQGETPSASAVDNVVTVSWAGSTLSNGEGADGYIVNRYDAATPFALQTILSACTGTVTATTCTEIAPPGNWKYTVTPAFANNWRGVESAKSNAVTVALEDESIPVNTITRSLVTGNAVISGDTIFYRGESAGSFRLINAVTEIDEGAASSGTAPLAGTTTGWTHSPSTVATPAGGPYVSNLFSWSAGTTSAPTEVVTGTDLGGGHLDTTLSFVNDSTAPTAGSISYAAGYQADRSVAITFTAGTDGGSGLGAPQLQRSYAPLTAGSCGSYSSFANLGAASPVSPYTDSSVTNGLCYKYQYVVADLVGNQDIATSANVAMVDYSGGVNATTGLLSQWRLGESAANLTSSDSFTGSTTNLTNHTGERGATWQYEAGSSSSFERISNANRVRGGGSGGGSNGYSINNTNTTPPSPDYSVEADLVVVSNLSGDMAGVIGRLNTSNTTFYIARYEQAGARWNLVSYDNSNSPKATSLGVAAHALTVGQAYRVRLSMTGTAISLYVNGVLTVGPVTDGTWTAAGKAGIMDGEISSSPAKSDTVGLHFDNFQVTPSTYPQAADSKGSNTGDYLNGPTLGAAGALAGDANSAAAFNGTNDYVQAVGTTGIPVGASLRSVEMWFKTSSAARQVLFAYGTLANTQEFGLWLNAGGASMTAWGTSETSTDNKTFTLASAVNNGAWHQVVKTYDGTSITLYIDGVALTPQAAARATVMDSYGFGIGAVINPGDATNSGGFFNGSLDEVSFYTTALDQTTITSHYQLGSSPTPDVSGPTGGSVAASGLVGTGTLYAPSTILSLNLAKGTDPSGVAATGAQLLRATAPLTSGTCGSYGSYALVPDGTDPASPKSDTVSDHACYRYQYVVADLLGNSTTYTSSGIKVDTTAPASPTLTFGTFTNAYWSSGSTVFYRSAAASGSFRATASATDSGSGIASYAFPTLGASWTSTPGSLGVNTYAWSGAPAAPGLKSVTAANNATGTSPGTPFILTADDTAPTAGTVTYLDGNSTSTSLSVSFTTGTDSGSGLGNRLLQRASATLTGSSCGAFGAFSTRSTNPASSPYADTITTGNCYKYQYLVPDNVGNQDIATSTNVVKVDNAGPTGGSVAASDLVGTGSLYSTSTTLSLNLTKGTDPSGIATTGNQLIRATATLNNGSCSSYGSYTLVTDGTDPASPTSDTVADQACYRYRYVVADTLGNSATYQGTDIKVDTTAPTAPSLTFGTFSNTYWSSGSTVYYRTAAASGQFTATASATDTASGILSSGYGFPTSLGTNWSTSGTTTSRTYSWSGSPAPPGTNSVTATNNATLTSAGTSFTLTADDTAPATGTVTYLSGATSGTPVSVTFTSGTDTGGSGIGTRLLQRAAAPLSSGVCGSYGSFTTVTGGTNPTSPLSDTVPNRGFCYVYQYVVQDNVGNPAPLATSPNVVTVPTYLDFIKGTTGLVSHWRLGDSLTASDTFTDTAGVTLQSHTAAIGSPWTKHAASTTDAVITNSNRIRKNGSSTLGALYYSSGVPASADYTVQADVYRPGSEVTNDLVGIVGRLDTANALGTYYGAVYDKTAGSWVLYSMDNGVKASLGTPYNASLSNGVSYHVSLDMNGSTIRLLVNGTQRVSATDSTVTAAGRAGVTMGFGASNTTVDNTTGMHLDNFQVSASVADSWGTNTGSYLNGPTPGVAGALAGDSNTAVTFDGTNDYATVARQISDDFSIEFWFKSTAGNGTSTGWWQGAGLIDAEGATPAHDFGVSLRSDGRIVAGVGDPSGGSTSIVSSTTSGDNGNWHHVVFTRTKGSGALTLYVDGASAATGIGSTASLTSPANIDFGRILTGSRYLSGSMDEIAVYNMVLSAATVTEHNDAAR
jgi:hypothetical protein